MNPYEAPPTQPQPQFSVGWTLATIFALLILWDHFTISRLRAELEVKNKFIDIVINPFINYRPIIPIPNHDRTTTPTILPPSPQSPAQANHQPTR